MVDEDLDGVLHALAHPARRDILRRLAHGPCPVGELHAPLAREMSLAAVSKHVKVLERAALLEQTRRGRQRVCRLAGASLREVEALIAELREPAARTWTPRWQR